MSNINMLDLAGEYKLMRDEIRTAIDEVLEGQKFIGGPQIAELETALAELCGTPHAVAVSSGTDALVCALMSLDLKPGDEVITTPFTFFATAGSVARTGATPVFVDIEPDTFNIDPSAIEAAITERTKLIIPVHLFGQCADMPAIQRIADRHGIPILEDAAQAIGATQNARPAGSFGMAATLSFYPTKNLGGFGEGGMIVTGDEAFAARCRQMRNHGETSRYHHQFVGGNFRLDTLKAAILLVRLRHLNRLQAARLRNAAIYDELLGGEGIETPKVRPGNTHIYHQYCILADDRDGLMERLKQAGIASAIYYPVPLYRQECFRSLACSPDDFPVSESTARRILALPIHPMLSEAQVRQVAGAVTAHAASNRVGARG